MIYATTWVVLENITLSEVSQTEDKYYLRFHLYEDSRTGKNQKEQNRGYQRLRAKRELLFNG